MHSWLLGPICASSLLKPAAHAHMRPASCTACAAAHLIFVQAQHISHTLPHEPKGHRQPALACTCGGARGKGELLWSWVGSGGASGKGEVF